jgi:hypothetical protein
LYSDSAEAILEDIERQFHLDADVLVSLTKAYLDELAVGLGAYGNALAMMCVLFLGGEMCDIWLMIGITVLRSSLVCPMVLRQGEFMAILIWCLQF